MLQGNKKSWKWLKYCCGITCGRDLSLCGRRQKYCFLGSNCEDVPRKDLCHCEQGSTFILSEVIILRSLIFRELCVCFSWREGGFTRSKRYTIRVHRQAFFAQSATLCFQYLGFHDHTFNRAKLANYVICPGFHGFRRGFQ